MNDARIGVNRLEEVQGMISGVADFNGRVSGEFTLETEAPGMYLVRAEVARHGRIRERPGIKHASLKGRPRNCTYVRSGGNQGYREGCCRRCGIAAACRSEALSEHLGRRRGHVDVDVVERRIIQH